MGVSLASIVSNNLLLGSVTDSEIVDIYNNDSSLQSACIATVYKQNEALFNYLSNKYYTVNSEEIESTILESIAIGLYSYDLDQKAKLNTYIFNIIRNGLNRLLKFNKTTTKVREWTSVENYSDIEELYEDASLSKVDMSESITTIGLSDNEYAYCQFIINTEFSDEYSNAEIAKMLGLSRSGVAKIKTRLKAILVDNGLF